MPIAILISSLCCGVALFAPSISAGTLATKSNLLEAPLYGSARLKERPIIVTREGIDMVSSTSNKAQGEVSVQISSPKDREELKAVVETIMKKDPNVVAVVLSEDEVMFSYRQPVKLFGFVRLYVPVRVSIDASGKTSVQYPWYGPLLSSEKTALVVRTEAVADTHVSSETRSRSLFSLETEARLLRALHATLESQATGDIARENP